MGSEAPFKFGAGAGPKKKTTKKKPAGGFMTPKVDPNDPLKDVPVTGNVETDAAAELDALAEGFRSRRDQEEKRFKQATDTEYWFAVTFKSREDKDAFLAAVGQVRRLGDKYIDGYALARVLGLDPSFED